MRRLTSPAASIAGMAALVALGLGACSSATTAPPPLRQAAPAPIDCGSDPNEASSQSVMVVNRSSSIVNIWVRGVDCYDWGGTSNPSRLDGIELSPGVSSANETLVVREIPQANNQIRPWDMGIFSWDGGRWLSAKVEPRPTFGAAQQTCNTVKGFTACLGVSLCPGPDYRERRVEVPLLNTDATDSGRRIVVTTYCSLADHQARMVLTDG